MLRRLLSLTLMLIVAGGMAAAQDREDTRGERERGDTTRRELPTTAEEGEASTSDTERATTTERQRTADRVRRASRLPRTTSQAREAGVPEERVRETIRVARERGIPADEAQRILEVETEAVRQGGNPDNFGSFVQQAKESGLRGRELAEAIHAEQIARGMKKPGKGQDDDRDGKARGKGKGHDKSSGKKGGDR